jgi:PhzF family phenazine biosynthesis protein
MTTGVPAVLVEAFTTVACQGNGAAVVLLDQPVSDGWMQQLARSLNQSETAFLLPAQQGWALRWFTPSCEVPLCGHATLAALLALDHWQRLDREGQTTFFTRSGPLQVALRQGLAQIQLPSASLEPGEAPAYLRSLLSQSGNGDPLAYWRSALGYSVVLLQEDAPLEALASLSPQLQPPETGGLVLMQALGTQADAPTVAGQRADYQLRFFAPGLGIDEDPVTGSAHALVAPYWQKQLGRRQVVGWQCSPRPGGMVCEAGSSGMIRLSGSGVLLWCGSLQRQPDNCPAAGGHWQKLCSVV